MDFGFLCLFFTNSLNENIKCFFVVLCFFISSTFVLIFNKKFEIKSKGVHLNFSVGQ